jgi:hypothetical protein
MLNPVSFWRQSRSIVLYGRFIEQHCNIRRFCLVEDHFLWLCWWNQYEWKVISNLLLLSPPFHPMTLFSWVIRYFMFIYVKNVILSHTLIVWCEQSSATNSPIQRHNLLPISTVSVFICSGWGSNPSGKGITLYMTTDSSRQIPNIFVKMKQQLEHLQHSDMQPLVGMFTKMWKITTGFSCMPVNMEQLGSHHMNFHEILRNFWKPAEEIQASC